MSNEIIDTRKARWRAPGLARRFASSTLLTDMVVIVALGVVLLYSCGAASWLTERDASQARDDGPDVTPAIRAPEPIVPTPLLPKPLHQALGRFARRHSELAEYLPRQGAIRLKADLTFQAGTDYVRPAAAEALRALAEIGNTPSGKKHHVYVAGHTDDVRITKPTLKRRHPSNWYYSVHRAIAVQAELIRAGLAPQRAAVMGFGQYHPLAPNKPGSKGNPRNRRIEIFFVPPGRFRTTR